MSSDETLIMGGLLAVAAFALGAWAGQWDPLLGYFTAWAVGCPAATVVVIGLLKKRAGF